MLDTPISIRTLKFSNIGRGQCLDGRFSKEFQVLFVLYGQFEYSMCRLSFVLVMLPYKKQSHSQQVCHVGYTNFHNNTEVQQHWAWMGDHPRRFRFYLYYTGSLSTACIDSLLSQWSYLTKKQSHSQPVYHVGYTSSHSNIKVQQNRASLVLGWETIQGISGSAGAAVVV